jgi:hypothetical protein
LSVHRTSLRCSCTMLLLCHHAAGLVKWVNFSSLRLLYSATRNGFSSQQFHTRCDGSGATLVLVRSAAGHVFGGYTPSDWGAQSRLDCMESFIFHVTCEGGAAPERYSRRWVAEVLSQSENRSGGFGCTNYCHCAYPIPPAAHQCFGQKSRGLYGQQVDAAKGPTFGARFTITNGHQQVVPGSVCNDMMIDLDAKHGVARFVSFYDHISAEERRLCAFTPHNAKPGLFQMAIVTSFSSQDFSSRPMPYDCPQLVLTYQPNIHAAHPAAYCHPCFELADVEVFQCSS